jgi:mRNA interferase MazF
VLTALPQADGRQKNRPAVALRRMPSFGDWLLCGISTQFQHEIAGFDDSIISGHVDFESSGLKAPSLIRLGFLTVVPEARLLGVIGSLAPERHQR